MVTDVELIEAAEIRHAELKLAEFQRQAWSLVESKPFVNNWHIDCICEHLQALATGEIKKLLINIPPGTSKSLNTCVFFPAWAWATDPQLRFLFASYDGELSTRDSVRCRTIIESSWYRRRWGHIVKLKKDENQKTRYFTEANGYRLSTMVDGHGTGEHPDIIGVDDPHSVSMAESDKFLQTAIEWWDLTMSSRGVARDVRKVISMQRLRANDLSGHVMKEGDWVILCLPMRYEPNRMTTTPLGWNDPRTVEGELLWPDLYTEEKVRELETKLGSYGTAGQLQQRPSPKGGGTFQRASFKIVENAPNVSRRIARSWDVASVANGGDATASCKMSEVNGDFYIESVTEDRLDIGPRDNLILETAKQDGRSVTTTLPRDPAAAGKAQTVYWAKMLSGFDVRMIPVTGDKQKRSAPLASSVSAGHVYLVRGEWNDKFLDQADVFPRGAHDDMIDAAADAYNTLTNMSESIVDPDWIRKFEVSGAICRCTGPNDSVITVDQRSISRFAIVCADSLVGASGDIPSSNWSGIQIWDTCRENKIHLIKYAWSGKLNWHELRAKIADVAEQTKTTTWCVIFNDRSRQVYADLSGGHVSGVKSVEFINERNVLESYGNFVNYLCEGRIHINGSRSEDCEQIERDWCGAYRSEKVAPVHLKLSVHAVEFSQHQMEAWSSGIDSRGSFTNWSLASGNKIPGW